MARIRTADYILPEHWACTLINGDSSGNTDEDDADIDAFIAAHPELGQCLSVSDDSWFAPCNDFSDLGGHVCQYTFPILTKGA